MDDARNPDPFDSLMRGWRAYALIALVSLLATLPGLASLPVLDRDEARFAQASRQMLETGDFVRINVQDEPRNKKPIGIHWLQAATASAVEPMTGDLNTIWAYRLPSLIGALLTALAAFWGGQALVGRRAALLGACLLAASFLLSWEGLIAKTDGMLAGVTTVAMAALARLRERVTPGRGLAFVFWIAVGAGALLKGPVTPMVAGLTLLMLALWERRSRWMAPLAWWPGPVAATLIVAPWLVAIQVATNGAFLREAIFGDLAPKLAGGHEGHSGFPGFHVALLALTFFPATLGLAPGAMLAWNALRAPRTDGGQAAFRFLIAWILPTWLVFELLPTKLPHYVLPTFPALALLAGAGLVAAEARSWRVSPLISFIFFTIGAAALVAIVAAATTFMPGDQAAAHRRAIQTLLVGGAGVAAMLAAILILKQTWLRVGLAVAVAVGGLWLLRERIFPEARSLQVSAELAAALRRNDLADAPLTVIGYRETSLAFETRTDVRLLAEDHWRSVAKAASAGEAVAITCQRAPDFATTLTQRGLVFDLVAEVQGRNYGNGDKVCLNLGRVSDRRVLLPGGLAEHGPHQLP